VAGAAVGRVFEWVHPNRPETGPFFASNVATASTDEGVHERKACCFARNVSSGIPTPALETNTPIIES